MRIVIFAGGAGRRLWPISRESSPKQFEPIVGDLSTLQLAVARVAPHYGHDNIFIATNERYGDIVRAQLPQLPRGNVFAEPARRDLGPAVGLAMTHVARLGENEPVAILWSDNFIEDEAAFVGLLQAAEALIARGEADILFIGETPRFANENLGWIGLGPFAGEIDGQPYFAFERLSYRPPLELCREMFEGGQHVWNTGFFITTPAVVRRLYRHYLPEMWQQLQAIEAAIGGDDFETTLHAIYPTLPAISFDDAILTHLDPERALVLHSHMGWSDPGTLYALKETLDTDPAANVTKGLVIDSASTDCLIYNYEPDKLLVAIGLEGMIVVNMDDALLVVHKDHIPRVKEIITGLRGTELEKYG